MASRFWVGGTGTWDASDTTHWAASTGGAGGQSVPGSSDTVTLDGSSGGGTVTVNTTVNVTSITMGAFTGTLDFAPNDNNVTVSTFDCSGSGTRTLNMGDGTWTLTATNGGAIWNVLTPTNLTLNCNASTITTSAVADGSRTFILGGKTYNNWVVANPSINALPLTFNPSTTSTIANLTVTNAGNLLISGSLTLVITGALSINGTVANPCVLAPTFATATLSVANATALQWLAIYGIVKAGAGSIAALNSFDCGGNTGVSIFRPGASVIGG